MTVCDKLDTPDNCQQIRESIEAMFYPAPDRVTVEISKEHEFVRVTAKYDKMGMLHIIRVNTEERIIDGVTHEKGEIHQTLSFPKENYRVSQDFDPNGIPLPGTAHIKDQNTDEVVWKESDPNK